MVLPHELSILLEGYTMIRNNEGYSQAIVFQCEKDGEKLFLKVERSDSEIKREYNVTKWLSSKLPVPEIKFFAERDGFCFMLTTAITGYKAGTAHDEVSEPYETTIKLLADGLRMVQGVDITDCPFVTDYEARFQYAVKNIEEKYHKMFVEVDNGMYAELNRLGQFRYGKQTDRDFDSPAEFYDWLNKNKPQSSDEICFTHGDYGLTNTFIDGGKVTGFIDVGGGSATCKWFDIAICIRSIGYHSKNVEQKHKYVDLLFDRLNIVPGWDKIDFYIWVERMFSLTF